MKKRLVSGLLLLVMLFLSLAPALANQVVIGYVEVTHTRNVNVRTGPSTSYGIITSVAPNSRFECIGISENGWYNIKLSSNTSGYITNQYTKFEQINSSVNPGSVYSVPVYYRTTKGTVLNTYQHPLYVGANTVSVDYTKIGSGYKLVSSSNVNVNLSSDGKPTPAAILFLFVEDSSAGSSVTPPATNKARVNILYKDVFGTTIASEYKDLSAGVHTINANSALIPSGYKLVGSSSALVSISTNLVSTPSEISFIILGSGTNPGQSASPTLEVKYVGTNGVLLYTDNVALISGTNTVYANDSLVPSGYSLYSQRSTQVFVNNQGTVSPSSITFLYQPKPQSQNASVPVHYRTDTGESLYSETLSLAPGTRTVSANDNRVPGYVLQSSRNVTVYVSNDGFASPASVVFTYKQAQQALLEIIYEDNGGNIFYNENRSLMQGTHTIKVNNKNVPSGYTLTSANSFKVVVDANGSISPSKVRFTFIPPVSAIVIVNYVDEGSSVVANESVSIKYGNNVIRPNGNIVPSGFKVAGTTSYDVYVDQNGTPSLSSVNFQLAPYTPSENPANTLPNYQKARLEGQYDVYTGPGTDYYRANGNASVSGGVCRWFGYEGSWVLMGYETSSGSYRIGFIDAAATPSSVSLPNLSYSSESVTLISDAKFTDDPIIKVGTLFTIPKGTTVTFLAHLPNSKWAYIETTYNGQTARGFINKAHLGK